MRYIGSKVQLLEAIESVLLDNNVKAKTFLDIFSGTGSVARYFKKKYQIYSNDILYFSYVLQYATIQNDSVPNFDKINEYLGKNVFDYLSSIESYTKGKYNDDRLFIRNNFTDFCGRNYLTSENGLRIDLWRLEIEEWLKLSLITQDEYFYLIACIVEAIPFYSNISGTYGAFLKTWDPRALKRIELVKIDVETNKKDNKSYNLDGELLIKRVNGDILYIDPPYNERQYLPNYHLLETIAKYDYPVIKGVTGIRDYDIEKSKFCSKKTVYEAFENLVKNANFKYILLSYNTDGIMGEDEIISIMSKYDVNGNCKVYRFPHKRFKSRTLVNTSDLHELIFFIEKKTNKVLLESNSSLIKSPLNYIGGKTKILPQLLNYFPDKVSTFVDLFCGGLNVGININAQTIIANDINNYIMEMFEYFKKTNVNELLQSIDRIIFEYSLSKNNQVGYLKLREDYNAKKNPLYLFVLTCFSFNHQIRYNNDFEFNCPFGKDRSTYNESIKKNLIRFVTKLQQTESVIFSSVNFTKVDLSTLDKDSLVYCDPPYLITTGSYNDGTRGFGNWTYRNDVQLLDLLDMLNNKNIKFALSNVYEHMGVKNDLLIEWAKKYNVYEISNNYNNSNYQSNAKQHKTVEVLVTNFKVNK